MVLAHYIFFLVLTLKLYWCNHKTGQCEMWNLACKMTTLVVFIFSNPSPSTELYCNSSLVCSSLTVKIISISLGWPIKEQNWVLHARRTILILFILSNLSWPVSTIHFFHSLVCNSIIPDTWQNYKIGEVIAYKNYFVLIFQLSPLRFIICLFLLVTSRS